MSFLARKLVSKNKRRFVSTDDSGFDLDLTYITDNIIAMGFPSESIEGVYRNPMSEVVRFLEKRHAGKYRVYNLCSERSYDAQKFHGRVACYPFDDHNAPPIEMIRPFCEDVENWIHLDPENVTVIHCKAGKGRTGVMICCYLLHSRMWTEAPDALKFYGAYRTENSKGVTIPSQIRYVGYYAELLNKGVMYHPRTVFLKKVTVHTMPRISSNGTCVRYFFVEAIALKLAPLVIISKTNTKIFGSKVLENLTKDQKTIEIPFPSILPLCGDIKVEFYHKDKFKKPAKMFHFWFNTFFVSKTELVLTKGEIDKANKDKKHSTYDADFKVTLEMVILNDDVESSLQRVSFHEFIAEVLTEEEEDLSDDDSVVEEEDNPEKGSIEFA